MPELLIELFSEEIPARMQHKAGEDLKKGITDGLVEAGLTYASAGAFTTPRRLALSVEGLSAASPRVEEERKGPRVDAPEKAIEGFLRATGLSREDLEIRDEKKGQVFFARMVREGREADEIVAEVLEKVVRTFPWPKSMRWGSGRLRWVRPLHSILCLLHDETSGETRAVDLEIEGIRAGTTTRGHRFLAPAPFEVSNFASYQAGLEAAHVVLDPARRAEKIRHDAENLAFSQGLEVVEDPGLLREVAGLVEWPMVLMGEIEEAFLGLPPEVLQSSMREHQKFFSLRNPGTGRIEKFITVANTQTSDDGATILAGNQKVLAARLSDARFFWENDQRIAREEKMVPWLAALENVTFHNKLGSQHDRIGRIAALAGDLAGPSGADAAQAREAARIAKADLSSEMVYEFPELQGLMGSHYARAAGYAPEVAAVAHSHWAPLGPSDDVPTEPLGMAVALADKLDILTGFWAIDEKPTGSRDPFALRRAALGVIRIVLENDLTAPLGQFIDTQLVRHKASEHLAATLVEEIARFGVFGAAYRSLRDHFDGDDEDTEALYALEGAVPALSEDLLGFVHDRLKVYLRDRGIRHDVIDACLAMPGKDDLRLLALRAQALEDVLATAEGENLLQGFRRAHNLLTQAEAKDGVEYSFGADPALAQEPSEAALFEALEEAGPRISAALDQEDFTAAVRAMADLRAPIDAFFDAVQINADNAMLRRNRLNLLHSICETCQRVADLRCLEG